MGEIREEWAGGGEMEDWIKEVVKEGKGKGKTGIEGLSL